MAIINTPYLKQIQPHLDQLYNEMLRRSGESIYRTLDKRIMSQDETTPTRTPRKKLTKAMKRRQAVTELLSRAATELELTIKDYERGYLTPEGVVKRTQDTVTECVYPAQELLSPEVGF